jgi:hypothetical protein
VVGRHQSGRASKTVTSNLERSRDPLGRLMLHSFPVGGGR